MDKLYEFMKMRLRDTTSCFFRYIYDNICWNNRMLAIVGPRGVGKTTMILQHIKSKHSSDDTLYITADHMYFGNHTLADTAETFVKNGGRFLFIDEIHKYNGWSRELKQIYDSFSELHVCFTGSSILDIEKGEADLSRRAPRYVMQGLSFREFLKIRHDIDCPVFTLDDVLRSDIEIPYIKHPIPYFKEYLKTGYYPFGSDPDFRTELEQVISRTLEIDIPQFANMNMATGRKLKRLMAILSELVPYKPTFSELAGRIGTSRNNIEDYLILMEKAGMLSILRDGTGGLGELGKIEKVYLDNTNIMEVLADREADIGTVRETFFFNQMRVRNKITSSSISDFSIDGKTFEVGGKSKKKNQIKTAEQGYVVKDDIEYGHGNVVPLWVFGLNY